MRNSKNTLLTSMKKVFSILIVVCIVFAAIPLSVSAAGTEIASGTCGENLTWVLDDGGLLTISGTGEMFDYSMNSWGGTNAPWYFKQIKEIVIGNGVTTIGDYAFKDSDKLISVAIGENVIDIGDYAFANCSKLQDVKIGDGVINIGNHAFGSCDELNSISVTEGNSVYSSDEQGVLLNKEKTILIQAPGALTGHYSIPAGVTTVEDFAFSGCYNLEGVTIADSVTTLGDGVFSECLKLNSITIPASVTSIGKEVFCVCFALDSIYVMEENPVYSSDEAGALYNKTKTTLIYVPYTISGHYSIRPGVTTIEGAFDTHKNITSVELPDSIIIIGDNAFSGCDGLESMEIPDSVTTIGRHAFSMTGLSSIELPNSITSIGDGAFSGCSNLTCIEIPYGVGVIGAQTFLWCENLVNVTIPSSVVAIWDQAFQYTRLTEVTIPLNVQTIGKEAFGYCDISTITFQGDAPSIGSDAFYFVEATAHYPVDNDTWTEEVMQNYGGTITWESYEPEASGTCGENLTWNVTDGVLNISGYGAMNDYPGYGSAPWIIHEDIITEIHIDEGVTAIGNFAFSELTNVTLVDIPDSVSHIGDFAFHYCIGMNYIEIPDIVESIGQGAFLYCTNLESIKLPEDMTEIAMGLFEQCHGLTNVNIGSKVTRIGSGAFLACDALESISIPASVTEIGWGAFMASGLKNVIFDGNAPVIGEEAFAFVTAEIAYPVGNTTWTADVMQNYGGTITWVPYGEASEPTAKFTTISTSLGGNIAMNFYLELSEDLVAAPEAYIQFTYAGRTVNVPLSQGVLSGNTYRFSCPITSKNMTDEITAQVYNGSGPVGESKTMDVATYCNWVIANYTDAKTVNLMKAMLNYGASAQLLFNYRTDDLANAALSDADKVLGKVDASAYVHSRTGEEDGIKPDNYTLLLDSETTVRVYFKLTGDKTIDEYTFTVDGVEVEPVYKDGLYYIQKTDIGAHRLDELHVFTCGNITIRYGGLSYVNQVMTYYTEGTTFDMASALFAYSKAAEEYIG